jgi:hypothetical protein
MLTQKMITYLEKLHGCDLDVDAMIDDPPIILPDTVGSTFTWTDESVEDLIVEVLELIMADAVSLTTLIYFTYRAFDAYIWVKSTGAPIDTGLVVHLGTIVCQVTKNLLDSGKFVHLAARRGGECSIPVLSLSFYDGRSRMPGNWVDIR